MAEVTYPFSYPTAQRTMAEIESRNTVKKLNPEFWRRFKALMLEGARVGVQVGPGGGWRIQTANPDGTALPGHALPGNSNHEGFPADGVSGGAVAIDALGDLAWMEKNLSRFGLRSFRRSTNPSYKGTDEPWHVQPVEIPASRSWRKAPWVLPVFPLPGVVVPPVTPTPVPPDSTHGTYNGHDIWYPNTATPTGNPALKLNSTYKDQVKALQQCLGITADGGFGPKTEAAVKAFQSNTGSTVDGVFGPKTAEKLKAWRGR